MKVWKWVFSHQGLYVLAAAAHAAVALGLHEAVVVWGMVAVYLALAVRG